MKTNFQMIRELDGFVPEHRGILSNKEVQHIASALHVAEMDELGLRNLRDFAVMYFHRKVERLEKDSNVEEMYKALDVLSAVTGVIDNQLWSIGAEV